MLEDSVCVIIMSYFSFEKKEKKEKKKDEAI